MSAAASSAPGEPELPKPKWWILEVTSPVATHTDPLLRTVPSRSLVPNVKFRAELIPRDGKKKVFRCEFPKGPFIIDSRVTVTTLGYRREYFDPDSSAIKVVDDPFRNADDVQVFLAEMWEERRCAWREHAPYDFNMWQSRFLPLWLYHAPDGDVKADLWTPAVVTKDEDTQKVTALVAAISTVTGTVTMASMQSRIPDGTASAKASEDKNLFSELVGQTAGKIAAPLASLYFAAVLTPYLATHMVSQAAISAAAINTAQASTALGAAGQIANVFGVFSIPGATTAFNTISEFTTSMVSSATEAATGVSTAANAQASSEARAAAAAPAEAVGKLVGNVAERSVAFATAEIGQKLIAYTSDSAPLQARCNAENRNANSGMTFDPSTTQQMTGLNYVSQSKIAFYSNALYAAGIQYLTGGKTDIRPQMLSEFRLAGYDTAMFKFDSFKNMAHHRNTFKDYTGQGESVRSAWDAPIHTLITSTPPRVQLLACLTSASTTDEFGTANRPARYYAAAQILGADTLYPSHDTIESAKRADPMEQGAFNQAVVDAEENLDAEIKNHDTNACSRGNYALFNFPHPLYAAVVTFSADRGAVLTGEKGPATELLKLICYKPAAGAPVIKLSNKDKRSVFYVSALLTQMPNFVPTIPTIENTNTDLFKAMLPVNVMSFTVGDAFERVSQEMYTFTKKDTRIKHFEVRYRQGDNRPIAQSERKRFNYAVMCATGVSVLWKEAAAARVMEVDAK